MAKQKQSTYSDFLTNGQHLITALLANIAELPHLEAPLAKLQAFLEQVRTLAIQHDFYTANKLQVSKQLGTLLSSGRKLATFLRSGLREHYGNRSDKLLEFGLPPFRRRAPKAPVEPPEGENPPVSAAPDDFQKV